MAVVCEWQSAEAVRKQRLRLMRLSEAVRRDDALRTTRHRLRQTNHWSLIDDRQRRAFLELCDEVRSERRHQRCIDVQLDSHAADQKSSSSSSTESDAPSQRLCVDKATTECTDKGLAAVPKSSFSSMAATTTTTTSICFVAVNEHMTNAGSVQHTASPTSTEVVEPLCVTLHVTTTSNSTSGTRQAIVTSAALCVTTVDCSSTATTTEHLCVVMTSASTAPTRQSCVTVSSTAARCSSRATSRLPSPTVRGRVTFDERPTEILATNGVVDSTDHKNDCKDNDKDSSSVVLASTLSTNTVTYANVDECGNLQRMSSNIVELSPASRGVRQVLNNNTKDSVQKVGNSTSNAPGVGGIKENVPPVSAQINGSVNVASLPSRMTTPERFSRPGSATHQHQAAVKQRTGSYGKSIVAVTSSARNSTVRPGKVPPPIPTRTSSVLTGGGMVVRSAASATARPVSWHAKANGHLSGKEPMPATPPPALRSTSVPPESTINNSLSHLSAFKRDKATVTADVTETEIH